MPADALKVLVTRPQEQSERLAEKLVQAGFKPLLAPMISIEKLPYGDDLKFDESIYHQDSLDGIIAISSNALRFFFEHLREQDLPIPATEKWFAIGQATAQAMRDLDIAPTLPANEFDTEGLLDLPDFQSIENKRFVILAGRGGRRKLERVLADRNAIVSRIELYKRIGITVSDIQISEQPDIMTCMSGETLDVLHRFVVSNELIGWLAKTLLVPSSRIAELAFEMGFRKVRVSEFASEKSLLIALSHLATEL